MRSVALCSGVCVCVTDGTVLCVSQPSKLQRVDGAPCGSERHFAELMAQKQRLQQLESEYALKIQKLKEAQALHNKGLQSELLAEPAARASTPPDPHLPPPPTSFPLPQPSLHDLTQDKLTLDSEDVPEADDHESEPAATPAPPPAAAAAKGARRHSFRQSSCSFTKPNLEQPSSTTAKDCSSTKPDKTSTSSTSSSSTSSSTSTSRIPVEMFAGLDVDALKLQYQQQARLGEVLQMELHRLGGHVDNPPPGQVSSKSCIRSPDKIRCSFIDSPREKFTVVLGGMTKNVYHSIFQNFKKQFHLESYTGLILQTCTL